MAGKFSFSLKEYQEAAVKYRADLLMLPIIGIGDTLQYMTGRPGIRYKERVGNLTGDAQFAPYNPQRAVDYNLGIEFRDLETYFGSVVANFEPNSAISTLLGTGATKGDGQMTTPTARHVLARIAKNLSEHLNDAVWNGKRNAAGDTTADLFDGWGTILDREMEEGNVSEAKGNLLTLGDKVTSANAVDVAKEIERSCHPILRRTDKLLFCDPAFADAYNDNYLLTHAGIVYNKQYDQPIVEGSGNKTTIVPLDCLAGTDKYILTPKSNMLYGYDNAGDNTRFEINRFSSWVLTIAAAMFFGTQFYTLDQRFLKVIKLSNV